MAITNRGAKKDFYHLVEIRSFDRVLSFYEKKCLSADKFVANKSLNWFKDAEAEPDPVTLSGINWTEVNELVFLALQEISKTD